VKSTTVYGGVGMQPQVDALRRGVDIVVATPGRLLDHVQQRTVDLKQVEILVLDEADRMLDMGFIHDIRKILALLPQARQNLLFSATFPEEIRKLAGTFMKNPATVEVARRNTPAELVAQVQHPVDHDRKRELLAHLVKTNDWRQVLVFCKTKHGANRLADQLSKGGIEADAIHGNKSQNARNRALRSFKDNELRVLVATDIAARGIDIEALPHVVNYDLPHVAEDYVHRIGRTGRAGSEGEAVSLVSHEDRPLMAAIERLMAREVSSRVIEGFEPGQRGTRPAAEERPSRGNGGRRPQNSQRQQRPQGQRQGQHQPQGQRPPQGGRPQRDGQRRSNGDRQPRFNGDQPRSSGQPRSNGGGQQRHGQRPQGQPHHARRHQAPARLPANIAAEQAAQLEEARARMRAEGEAAAPKKEGGISGFINGLLGNKR
jgi:ATP-dependent RNA helicase RhlE